ncbi:MAG: hypothetical protein HRT87_07225 [Legionellales bacterium]|nr:hypothetical protein [Legionellales bacterium]
MDRKEDLQMLQMFQSFSTVIQKNMPILQYNNSTGEYKFGAGMKYLLEQSMQPNHSSKCSNKESTDCQLL